MIGEIVGSYRIVSELGKGGMGVVYGAEHVQLGRPAAIKMLQSQLSSDPIIVQRFFNEARAASAIEHPGIVEVFDFGRHTDGSAYIVMALLRGESLDHRLLYGALPAVEGASLVAQVAAVLAAAHARGIVHRDLKPDNVFLVPNELIPGGVQVKLLDFGIAKLASEQQAGFKTQTGALIGTPAYMSPEQCMGRSDIDHRTDLYSLGCILFHVLTGRPPFLSDHGTGVMIAAHMRDPAPHVRSINPSVPDALAAVTMRLLEKDPAARYQTATELRAALVAAGANAPITKTPVGASVDATGDTMVALPSKPPPPSASGNVAYAATTASAGAGQVMTPQPVAPKPSHAGRWIAIGSVAVLAAVGGGIGIAMSGGGSDPAPSETVAKTPAVAPQAPEAPKPPAPPAKLAEAPKPPGPPPMPALVKAPGANPIGPVGQQIATVAAGPTPKFKLDAKQYGPGDPIAIKFTGVVHSPEKSRTWVTVVESGKPPTSYGDWKFVDDGANTATLTAPSHPGVYEIRVHADYPTKAFNVQSVVAFTITDPNAIVQAPPTAQVGVAMPKAQQRFSLAAGKVPVDGKIRIAFPAAMHALPKEQFWVTVVERGAADSTWGTYEYVKEGARFAELTAPNKPGDYEVRLHANYPTKTTNVVHRFPVRVE